MGCGSSVNRRLRTAEQVPLQAELQRSESSVSTTFENVSAHELTWDEISLPPPRFITLTGESLELNTSPDSTLGQLKQLVATLLDGLQYQVRILDGEALIEDAKILRELSGCDLLCLRDDFVGCEEGEFVIRVIKLDGVRLGIDVDHQDGCTLLIEHITDGAICDWNKNNPDLKVCVGQRIVEINGVSGDILSMVDECKKPQELVMKLRN